MIAFGETARGRTLYVFVASKDRAFTPEVARASENPVVLIINGIHSGEIMGKDASMILLRETLVEESASDLLDRLTLLVVPVYNADGHERSSPYNRINQNGPEDDGVAYDGAKSELEPRLAQSRRVRNSRDSLARARVGSGRGR